MFAGEHLGHQQLLGVVVVSASLLVLAQMPRPIRPTASRRPALLAAVMTGVVIATYTLRVHHRQVASLLRHPWLGAAGSVMSLAAYGLGHLGPDAGCALAAIAALRETSVIVAAVIGVVIFRERLGARRHARQRPVVPRRDRPKVVTPLTNT